jgi:ATP adenylyltransferase/5',5'''-P-1,P-4-tetraphosphate phosphorylase II
MPPSEKTLYNTNAIDFFTYIIKKIDKKQKEAEKIDKRVRCG